MSIYSNVKPSDNTNETFSNTSLKKTLYFSDGTLSVDELDGDLTSELDLTSKSVPVNPRELTWIPWMWYQTLSAGSKALEVCDYLGESLASFFGITTPKYQFEINEYYRIKKEEEEEAQNDIELGEWTRKYCSDNTGIGAISTGPKTLSSCNDNSISNG